MRRMRDHEELIDVYAPPTPWRYKLRDAFGLAAIVAAMIAALALAIPTFFYLIQLAGRAVQ